MSTIKDQLARLKESDVYSLLLFVLYKMHNTSEYSALSELSFLMDKDSLLRLCATLGGCTITVPTLDELQVLVTSLMLYAKVNIDGKDFEESINELGTDVENLRKIKSTYVTMSQVLSDYKFTSRA